MGKPGDIETDELVWAECPFCQGKYSLAHEVNVETSPGVIEKFTAALHTTPYCKKFAAAADALDFAVTARKARERLDAAAAAKRN